MSRFGDIIDQGEFVSAVVCQDCLFDLEADGGSDTRTSEQLAAAQVAVERYDITVGHVHDGPYAASHCYHLGRDCEDDCECERTDFSSETCGVCGTRLAGNRHDVIMVERSQLG